MGEGGVSSGQCTSMKLTDLFTVMESTLTESDVR